MLLPGILFISSVTNRYINNTLSTFKLATRGTTGGDVCISLAIWCATIKKKILELQVVILIEDKVKDDGEMEVEEQKMRKELWVKAKIEI